MIHFHNRVLDKLPAVGAARRRSSRRARKRVTLHYQWMIRHDYLPRICRPAIARRRVHERPQARRAGRRADDVPTMPIEFSVAAFRLGHSMIREAYNWNRHFPGTAGTLDFLFAFSGTSGDLLGDVRLPSNWIADWRRMYDFPAGGRPAARRARRRRQPRDAASTPCSPTRSRTCRWARSAATASIPDGDLRRNLAFRNLVRANMVKLASGQQMATRLKDLGVTLTPLTKAQILDGNGGAKLDHLTAAEKDAVADQHPAVVLRPARGRAQRRPAPAASAPGSWPRRSTGRWRAARFSIVRNPDWRPTLGRGDKFEMTDLLFFAMGGKAGLNPLGNG